MEAPEKIYLYQSDREGKEYEDEWMYSPWGEGCVEYIRTDAFIKRAYEYIANHFLVPGMDDEIEKFKNYMKGE